MHKAQRVLADALTDIIIGIIKALLGVPPKR